MYLIHWYKSGRDTRLFTREIHYGEFTVVDARFLQCSGTVSLKAIKTSVSRTAGLDRDTNRVYANTYCIMTLLKTWHSRSSTISVSSDMLSLKRPIGHVVTKDKREGMDCCLGWQCKRGVAKRTNTTSSEFLPNLHSQCGHIWTNTVIQFCSP